MTSDGDCQRKVVGVALVVGGLGRGRAAGVDRIVAAASARVTVRGAQGPALRRASCNVAAHVQCTQRSQSVFCTKKLSSALPEKSKNQQFLPPYKNRQTSVCTFASAYDRVQYNVLQSFTTREQDGAICWQPRNTRDFRAFPTFFDRHSFLTRKSLHNVINDHFSRIVRTFNLANTGKPSLQ